MKKLVLILALVGTASTASAWTEAVTCKIKRTSVDYQTTTEEVIEKEMSVDGRHNGETGSVGIKSNLIPSYSVVLALISSGRSDTLFLKSSLGSDIQAMSSIDGQLDNSSNPILNTFVTANGDYEISISCTTRTVSNQ